MDENVGTAEERVEGAVENYESLAGLIDYHFLRPEATDEDLERACDAARSLGVASLLVRPSDADQAVIWLGGSGVRVGSTVAYPDGSTTTAVKLYEGRDLLRRGVREIEFVMHAGKLISRQFQHVETEVMQMGRSCQESGATLRLVLAPSLPMDVRIISVKIAKRVEAQFLVVPHDPETLAVLRPLLKDRLALKASASTLDEALALRAAGYARIGVTDPGPMLREWKQRLAAQAAETPPVTS